MRLCLVEDDAVADLEPLTLTRPAFELRLGCDTLGARIGRAFGLGPRAGERGAIVRSSLASSLVHDGLAVNDRGWLAGGHVLVANSRWIPPAGFVAPELGGSWVGYCQGDPACAWVGPEHAAGLELNGIGGWFEEVAGEARPLDLGGEWVRRPWDLVARNADLLRRDLSSAGAVGGGRRDPAGLAVVGLMPAFCRRARAPPGVGEEGAGAPLVNDQGFDEAGADGDGGRVDAPVPAHAGCVPVG